MEKTDLQATINNNLKIAIISLTNSSPNSSLNGDFEIAFYNGNLLGIHFEGYSVTKGSAHPNKIDCGIHIDLTTGKVFKIEDLFKEGMDFESSIKELCLRHGDNYRLEVKGLWDGWSHEDLASSWAGENRTFVLLAKSMRIYTIPRYVTGAIGGYNVPYSDLMDIINTDGELWEKIQSQATGTVEVVLDKAQNETQTRKF